MAVVPQQFCVRWNSYHSNLQAVFPRLLTTEHFADVTLACESRQIKCHKLVLSACSSYFERLLVQNPCKHPIVFMKDMRFREMHALVDFMYKGEVNVTQDELPSLLKSAEALQIRGLCSAETANLASDLYNPRDCNLANDALLAQAHYSCTQNNSIPPKTYSNAAASTNGPTKKRKSEELDRPSTSAEVKEETVEEDGLYYGDIEQDHEFHQGEASGKPGCNLNQQSGYAISNVECQYESPSDTECDTASDITGVSVGISTRLSDHTYDGEPPAFIIKQVMGSSPAAYIDQGCQTNQSFVDIPPQSIQTDNYSPPNLSVIHVGEATRHADQIPTSTHSIPHTSLANTEYGNNKRIRRSEVVLKQAADCVSRGHTFQTVSEQFNIPISTIRFFMARKGILPRRRRGRSTHTTASCSSPDLEPPFHMQHFKLPNMVALKSDGDDDSPERKPPHCLEH